MLHLNWPITSFNFFTIFHIEIHIIYFDKYKRWIKVREMFLWMIHAHKYSNKEAKEYISRENTARSLKRSLAFPFVWQVLMVSSLNDSTPFPQQQSVMWWTRYLPEMSLSTLSLKLSNYTGQEPACGITTGRAQIACKSPTTALLIASILELTLI